MVYVNNLTKYCLEDVLNTFLYTSIGLYQREIDAVLTIVPIITPSNPIFLPSIIETTKLIIAVINGTYLS